MSRLETLRVLRSAIGLPVLAAEVLRYEDGADYVSVEFAPGRRLALAAEPEDWRSYVCRVGAVEIVSCALPWRIQIGGATLTGSRYAEARLRAAVERFIGNRLLAARLRGDGGLDLHFARAQLRFGPWGHTHTEGGGGWSVWRQPLCSVRVSETSLKDTFNTWGHL